MLLMDNEQSDRPGLAGHGDSGQRRGYPQGMAQCPSAPVPECRAPVDKLTWTLPMQKNLGARAIWDQR